MRSSAWGVAVLLAAAVACQPDDGGWLPVLESAPPAYLEAELERAAADVAGARERVDPTGDAAPLLDSAAQRLDTLFGVFMPLYRAKLDATNAYRYHSMGRDGDALDALDAVDELIGAVARETGGTLEAELEQVSAEAARARVALEAGSMEASSNLETLSETLTDLVTRAGIIL